MFIGPFTYAFDMSNIGWALEVNHGGLQADLKGRVWGAERRQGNISRQIQSQTPT